MAVYLVRHARAGDRETWGQPDELRALSGAGRRQADGLAGVLGSHPIARILSSRYVRCTQTVEPLAARLGLEVERADALAEEAAAEETLALLKEVSKTDAVLCTHGNVIPVVLDHLRHRGVVFDDVPHVWKKASTWVLDTDDGEFVTGRYLPPPS